MRTVPLFSRTLSSARSFHISVSNAFPRHPPARTAATEIPLALRNAASTEGITQEDFEQTNLGTRAQWSLDDIVENEKDISSVGHVYLGQQRQNLHYLRLIEHEMPKLVGEHTLRPASVHGLTRIASFSQAIRSPNLRKTARCPVHILWW